MRETGDTNGYHNRFRDTFILCLFKDKSVKSNNRGAGGTGFLTVEQGRDLKRNTLRVKKKKNKNCIRKKSDVNNIRLHS